MGEITQAEACCACCIAQAVCRAGWASGLEEVEEQADPLAGTPGKTMFYCVPWKERIFMESKAISWDHRVIQAILTRTPAQSRINYSRFLRGMSSQIFNISKAGKTTTPVYNPCQFSTTFIMRKFIQMSFLHFDLCPFLLVLSLGTTENRLVLSSLFHYQIFMNMDMTHISLLSFGLSSPGSFSLSIYERCSSPFTNFVALHETFLTGMPETGSSECYILPSHQLLLGCNHSVRLEEPSWKLLICWCLYEGSPSPCTWRFPDSTPESDHSTRFLFSFLCQTCRLSSHRNTASKAWSQVFGKDTEISVHLFFVFFWQVTLPIAHIPYYLSPLAA